MRTHQLQSSVATLWLDDSPNVARSQIATFLSSLGDDTCVYVSITRVPPDTEYDEFPDTDEWMQAGGDQTQGLLVEVKRLDPDGILRLYVVGRPAASQEADESAQVRIGDNVMAARKDEALNLEEAIELYVFYYEHNTVPDGWHLRPREEFSHEP